jgi:putative tryptophan/tyrosine transport system substrate-binding protein
VTRRKFITLLGGVAATWPLAVRAQQQTGTMRRRIGVLNTLLADDPHGQERIGAFLVGLQQAGWTSGGNMQVDQRWAIGDADAMRKFGAELVALAPEIILATGGVAVRPLLQVTSTVPIVFVNTPDPVGAGFVDSLARPGGNVTGFTQFEYSTSVKWLELLKHIAPGVIDSSAVNAWYSGGGGEMDGGGWKSRPHPFNSGTKFAIPSILTNDMVKHAACAAPSSSSGLVPGVSP